MPAACWRLSHTQAQKQAIEHKRRKARGRQNQVSGRRSRAPALGSGCCAEMAPPTVAFLPNSHTLALILAIGPGPKNKR